MACHYRGSSFHFERRRDAMRRSLLFIAVATTPLAAVAFFANRAGAADQPDNPPKKVAPPEAAPKDAGPRPATPNEAPPKDAAPKEAPPARPTTENPPSAVPREAPRDPRTAAPDPRAARDARRENR